MFQIRVGLRSKSQQGQLPNPTNITSWKLLMVWWEQGEFDPFKFLVDPLSQKRIWNPEILLGLISRTLQKQLVFLPIFPEWGSWVKKVCFCQLDIKRIMTSLTCGVRKALLNFFHRVKHTKPLWLDTQKKIIFSLHLTF